MIVLRFMTDSTCWCSMVLIISVVYVSGVVNTHGSVCKCQCYGQYTWKCLCVFEVWSIHVEVFVYVSYLANINESVCMC